MDSLRSWLVRSCKYAWVRDAGIWRNYFDKAIIKEAFIMTFHQFFLVSVLVLVLLFVYFWLVSGCIEWGAYLVEELYIFALFYLTDSSFCSASQVSWGEYWKNHHHKISYIFCVDCEGLYLLWSLQRKNDLGEETLCLRSLVVNPEFP